ncbi:MAG: rhomboid family intramembrane serine protease [Opitutaceae bacterium]
MASLKAADVDSRLQEEGFEAPEGLVPIAVHADFKRSGEVGLVILAMGDAYWTLMHGDQYVLCVDQQRANAVTAELHAYALLDKKKVQPGDSRYREFQFGGLSFLIYLLLLAAIFSFQDTYDLIARGRADSLAIVDAGQWWRAVTALTLHADIVHLVSNLVAGMGFAFFVARFFGAPLGWLLIVLSGTAGNLLNAWVYYPEPHLSIGASTAVFGALGILTGIGVMVALKEPEQRWSLPRWLVPIFGGLTLLGLIGVGDGLVDVAAHISGFLCGLVFGAVGTLWQPRLNQAKFIKIPSVCLLLSLLTLAWLLAFLSA